MQIDKYLEKKKREPWCRASFTFQPTGVGCFILWHMCALLATISEKSVVMSYYPSENLFWEKWLWHFMYFPWEKRYHNEQHKYGSCNTAFSDMKIHRSNYSLRRETKDLEFLGTCACKLQDQISEMKCTINHFTNLWVITSLSLYVNVVFFLPMLINCLNINKELL